MPFNVMFGVDVYASFEIDHSNEMELDIKMTYVFSFEIDHSLDLDFDGLRDRIGAFVMDLACEMDFSGIRDKIGKFDMECELKMDFDGKRYRVETIEYTGEFAPGDKIVIDTDKLKITQNNQNALHLMQGDFFSINVGQNELTYTDDQTGRTVRIRLTHRDRFV